ncbi:MAG: hypothetical protein Q4D98_04430 [Planctomycetia bacterium]|nr:hypothetical protein [Planctomycetia bacterium]
MGLTGQYASKAGKRTRNAATYPKVIRKTELAGERSNPHESGKRLTASQKRERQNAKAKAKRRMNRKAKAV